MIITLINPNLDGSPIPNLGLAYVISSIEKDHRIRLLDMSFHIRRYERYVLDNLKQDKPDVIGFSVTSFSFHYALKIASLIRNLYPDIPLVYGGVHPTLLPEETIQNPLVDAICIGEGEDSFKEYLDKLQNNQEPKGVAGIWYKDKSGSIIRNPLRPFIEDLDSIPFPNWDHWEMERYLKINESFVGGLRFLTSRGCPYSCTFCSNPAIRKAVPGKFYRLRSPENVIEEIRINKEKYSRMGFKRVAFGDATFGLDSEHLRQLCRMYVDENLHKELPWHCQTRPDIVTKEWTDVISMSGCCMVNLGVESGDTYIRTKIYRKEFSDDCILTAAKELEQRNIVYLLTLIIGCPEETEESVKNTLALLKKLRPLKVHITFYLNRNNVEDSGTIFKAWNMPRIGTNTISKNRLKKYTAIFFIKRLYNFFYYGIYYRNFLFFIDIFKYIFRVNQLRVVSIFNYCFLMGLELATVIEYVADRHKPHRYRGL